MRAAFIDIGAKRNAFLHFSDLAHGEKTGSIKEKSSAEHKNSYFSAPLTGFQVDPEKNLKKGAVLIVQLERETIGSKGPRVKARITIPGRYFILMPGIPHVGISRKIVDPSSREELKRFVQENYSAGTCGIIVRTAALNAGQDELKRDLVLLERLWSQILEKAESISVPGLLYEENDFFDHIIRDLFVSPGDRMVVDSPSLFVKIRDHLSAVAPELQSGISLYSGSQPIFEKYGIEKSIERIFNRQVWLKSGGILSIDHTEALVAIDVNTARSTGRTGSGNLIFNTNIEASREIARQVRLRNIGGIIVVDFIDMESEDNKKAVFEELNSAFSRDRSRRRILEFSEFGLVQITRKQIGPSSFHQSTEYCPTCRGKGSVLSKPALSAIICRALNRTFACNTEKDILVGVNPALAGYLEQDASADLEELEHKLGVEIEIQASYEYRINEYAIICRKTDDRISGSG